MLSAGRSLGSSPVPGPGPLGQALGCGSEFQLTTPAGAQGKQDTGKQELQCKGMIYTRNRAKGGLSYFCEAAFTTIRHG